MFKFVNAVFFAQQLALVHVVVGRPGGSATHSIAKKHNAALLNGKPAEQAIASGIFILIFC